MVRFFEYFLYFSEERNARDFGDLELVGFS